MKIKCKTGYLENVKNLKLFPSTLKKHSQLEISRLVDAYEQHGFLFPIAVTKRQDNIYIIDGEARYKALCEYMFINNIEDLEIPVFFIKCEKNIEFLMLAGTSTNHAVTQNSIEEFIKDKDINIKQLAFNTPSLLDFHTVDDLDLFFIMKGGKTKQVNEDVNYLEALK